MIIKTIMLKLSEEEKNNAMFARTDKDNTWEALFNRLVDRELKTRE